MIIEIFLQPNSSSFKYNLPYPPHPTIVIHLLNMPNSPQSACLIVHDNFTCKNQSNHLGNGGMGGAWEALLASACEEHLGAACVSKHAKQLCTLQQGVGS